MLDGVLMRSPHALSMVVRRRKGSLVVRELAMPNVRTGWRAWPFVRGVLVLVEALRLSRLSLNFSIEILEQDLEEEEREQEQARRAAQPPTSHLLSSLMLPWWQLFTSEPELASGASAPQAAKAEKNKSFLLTLFSVLLPLGLYVAAPQAIAEGVSSLFDLKLDVRSPLFQLITATAKVLLIVGVFSALRYSADMYRFLQCHGAEHKAIHTYEAGQALTVENARKFPTLHPRCGTTFIVMVAVVSIAIFSLLGPFLPQLGLGKLADNVLFFLMKLPFLPLIVGVTFELQRLFARHFAAGPLRVLLWPGFLVQKITTIEPTDDQLEVALSALLITLRVEQGEAVVSPVDATFPSYAALSEAPARAA